MTPTSLALILAGVLCNAAAQLFLKAGSNVIGVVSLGRGQILDAAWRVGTQPYYWGGFVCYAVSIVVWIMALSRVPVSVAYPMLSIGYVVNALAAWFLFGEPLTSTKCLGIFVIILGVWLVAKGA